jgi:hypothetical protein
MNLPKKLDFRIDKNRGTPEERCKAKANYLQSRRSKPFCSFCLFMGKGSLFYGTQSQPILSQQRYFFITFLLCVQFPPPPTRKATFP